MYVVYFCFLIRSQHAAHTVVCKKPSPAEISTARKTATVRGLARKKWFNLMIVTTTINRENKIANNDSSIILLKSNSLPCHCLHTTLPRRVCSLLPVDGGQSVQSHVIRASRFAHALPPHGASASQRTHRVIISILHTISVTSSRCRAQHNISLQRTSAHTRRRQARDTHIISTSHARTPENAHSPTRRKHTPSWSSKLFVYRVRACAFMRDDPEAHRRSRLRRQGRRDGGACVAEFAVLVMLCVCVCASASAWAYHVGWFYLSLLFCWTPLPSPPSPLPAEPSPASLRRIGSAINVPLASKQALL